MAKRLLSAGATANLPNMLGQTPLMYAANFGTEELVLMLLEALKPGGRKDVDSQGRYVCAEIKVNAMSKAFVAEAFSLRAAMPL